MEKKQIIIDIVDRNVPEWYLKKVCGEISELLGKRVISHDLFVNNDKWGWLNCDYPATGAPWNKERPGAK